MCFFKSDHSKMPLLQGKGGVGPRKGGQEKGAVRESKGLCFVKGK